MKPSRTLFALTLLLLTTPCLAMMSIEIVTRERAKTLGMDLRATAAGPDAVRVVLEFDIKGELKNFERVDLDLHDAGRLLASSTLREERPKEGRGSVSFAADRASLDKFTLRVVTRHGPRSMTGYDLKVKDFVDPSKVR